MKSLPGTWLDWRPLLALTLALGGLNQAAASGPFLPAGTVAAASHSGQFAVFSQRPVDLPWPLSNLATNPQYVRLEPMLVTVSCERVKQSLLRSLETTDTWRGKVFLVLHPAQSGNDTVTITSEKFKDNWRYRLDLPDLLERRRYVRVLVQVLLLEMANRGATDHAAEIPPWLADGLAQDLLVANEMELILSPPGQTVQGLALSRMQRTSRQQHPLARAQRVLLAHKPLSFDELSWPSDTEAASTEAVVYAYSSQVFVHELTRLPNGRAKLRALLGLLPQYYNWQLALLRAYRTEFGNLLDIEKWWALRLAQFTGRSLGDTWTVAESWQRLEAAIRLPVAVRTATNELPLRAEVKLQTVLEDWTPAQRNQALRGRVRQLQLLRPHLAPEFGPVSDEYCQALEAFLQPPPVKRGFRLPFRSKRGQPISVEQTVRRLNACDARLTQLRPATKSSPEPDQSELSLSVEPPSPI